MSFTNLMSTYTDPGFASSSQQPVSHFPESQYISQNNPMGQWSSQPEFEDYRYESPVSSPQVPFHHQYAEEGDEEEDETSDEEYQASEPASEPNPESSDSDASDSDASLFGQRERTLVVGSGDCTSESDGEDSRRYIGAGGMTHMHVNKVLRMPSYFDDDEDGPDPLNITGVRPRPVFTEEKSVIKLHMTFESKDELKEAVCRYSLKVHNREHLVQESKKKSWTAVCKSRHHSRQNSNSNGPVCGWKVHAVMKSKKSFWEITKLVDKHVCVGVPESRKFSNITSKMIGSSIRHLVGDNPTLSVDVVLKTASDHFGCDISYKRAWFARQYAIEAVFGTWEENFEWLPAFFDNLQDTNRGTIVQWKHKDGTYGSDHVFQYVFWAFRPNVEAWKYCRPVVSVDGTHLTGAYTGKLLIAVCHDANNNILPIAYAIVDQETTDSWSWFMAQLRPLLGDGPLCVISDRHAGLRNVMMNQDGWKEPNVAHRYCLRHIKSNYASQKGTTAEEKDLVWRIGAAVQKHKAKKYLKDLKDANPDGYNYLHTAQGSREALKRKMWCLAWDKDMRWGTLTTNISESYNNVLKPIRHLPIMALISATLTKNVKMFAVRTVQATNCSHHFPPRIWKMFEENDLAGKRHRPELYDAANLIYKVQTKYRSVTNKGGTCHTVRYSDRWCSCGKWSMYRRPCSHAFAVCRNRRDNPVDMYSPVYKVATFIEQYARGFTPMSDVQLWGDADWTLKGDEAMFKKRKRSKGDRRIRNEMDDRSADRKCSNCGQTGHTKNKCNAPPRERPESSRAPRKCSNCGHRGHTKNRCNAPPMERPESSRARSAQ